MQNSQGFSQGVFLSQGISHIFHCIFIGFHPVVEGNSGGTPLHGLYGDVPLDKVWFFDLSSKVVIHTFIIDFFVRCLSPSFFVITFIIIEVFF